MNIRKSYVDAFLDGYKPSMITKRRDKQLLTYPHNPTFDEEFGLGIFFQTEEQKCVFEKQMKDVEWGTYQYHYNLGIVLGFPLRSVKFYAAMRQLEDQTGEYPKEEEKNGVGVIWAGFFFSSHLDFVLDEIVWLWDKYNHPKAIENPLYLWDKETSYLEVPYGDFERLRETRNYIMMKRGLIPVT